MNNFNIDKKMLKKKNREATLKHYILGYILECVAKEELSTTRSFRILLIYDLKIITEETFITCIRIVRINKLAGINGGKSNYKKLKKLIRLVEYDYEKQLEIIHGLQEFASNYQNGIFVNSKMGESSYIGRV